MEVVVSMVVFVASHVGLAHSPLKAAAIRRFGRVTYLALYSSLSIILLAWVIKSLIQSERTPLWPAPQWSYLFAAVVSCAGFALMGAGAATANPLSVSFRKSTFDAKTPGIVGWTRHPLIWGLTLWGAAHVPANGDWPSVVLFAGAAGFGVLGVTLVERRNKRRFSAAQWDYLTSGRGHLNRDAAIGVIFGLITWSAFLTLHPILFGADPLAILRAQFQIGSNF
ncbi:MAG: NnrU family protein [Pseudomonadota bacterium]